MVSVARTLFAMLVLMAVALPHAAAAGDAAADNATKERIAKEGTAEDFDIRGLKVSMPVEAMQAFAAAQGWNHVVVPNAINTLVMCPKTVDCDTILSNEPSGSFRIKVRYDDAALYAIEYEMEVEATFDQVSKLILDKYGLPLRKNPKDKNEYFYGTNIADIRRTTKSVAYQNFLRDHIFQVRVSKFTRQADSKKMYSIKLYLSNPPKIDPEALKPLEPAL
ncbi:hypothetical protein [Megalodesulfovibrio paquesii]